LFWMRPRKDIQFEAEPTLVRFSCKICNENRDYNSLMGSKWIYYFVAFLLVIIYFLGEATDLLVITMFVILPVGYWVTEKIFSDKPSE
jgi:hypothetical protein